MVAALNSTVAFWQHEAWAPMLRDAFRFWFQYRDSETGLFCDNLQVTRAGAAAYFHSPPCGDQNNLYSVAATGMGLIADCVAAELGLLSGNEAQQRALQTITSLQTHWPRENHSGFYAHFTDRAQAATDRPFLTPDCYTPIRT